MRLFAFIMLAFLHLSWGFPIGTVIQIHHRGVVGEKRAVDQVLVDGVSLRSDAEVERIIRTMSTDAPLRTFSIEAVEEVNKTTLFNNHTFLRLRECASDGVRVRMRDSFLYDGTVYLTLNLTSDMWTARVPQALALESLWNQEPERTRKERDDLQKGCVKLLMMDYRISEGSPAATPSGFGVQMTSVLIPVIALLAFIALVLVTLLISKKQGSWHPGGVIGSVVHYPKDITESAPREKQSGYQAL